MAAAAAAMRQRCKSSCTSCASCWRSSSARLRPWSGGSQAGSPLRLQWRRQLPPAPTHPAHTSSTCSTAAAMGTMKRRSNGRGCRWRRRRRPRMPGRAVSRWMGRRRCCSRACCTGASLGATSGRHRRGTTRPRGAGDGRGAAARLCACRGLCDLGALACAVGVTNRRRGRPATLGTRSLRSPPPLAAAVTAACRGAATRDLSLLPRRIILVRHAESKGNVDPFQARAVAAARRGRHLLMGGGVAVAAHR